MIQGYRTQWNIAQPAPDHIIQGLGNLSVMLGHLLFVRGWETVDSILDFMMGEEIEHDPYLLPDMGPSVDRIRQALRAHEKVAIYGDFDCDGLTASAILFETLRELGTEPTVIIPERKEGHGIADFRLVQLAEDSISLVITVDTGISAKSEIDHAHRLGLDVIVTDHHTPELERPNSLIIHPSPPYPYAEISGAGVAYKLATALLGESPSFADDLVGLGTIADVVPLVDENRTFAARGLKKMRTGDRPGLASILRSSGVDIRRLQASSVAFYLAPKINSANRISSPQLAFDLLITRDDDIAKSLTKELSKSNRQRKDLLNSSFTSIISEIDKEQFLLDIASGAVPPILIVYGEWTNGLSGLIASRLADTYGIPAICACDNEWGEIVASARSVPGVDIFELLHESAPFFKKYGGHSGAAGFICRSTDDWEKAKLSIEKTASQRISLEKTSPTTLIDAEINLSQVTFYALEQIYKLGPYGHQFPEPTFVTFGVNLIKKKPTTDGRHLMATATSDGIEIRAVMFFHDLELETIEDNRKLDIVYNIEGNSWKGKTELQLLIRDWKYSDEIH